MGVVLGTRSLTRAESDRLVLGNFLRVFLVDFAAGWRGGVGGVVTKENSEPELKDVHKIPLLFHDVDED